LRKAIVYLCSMTEGSFVRLPCLPDISPVAGGGGGVPWGLDLKDISVEALRPPGWNDELAVMMARALFRSQDKLEPRLLYQSGPDPYTP
jgi:hypothetical protein